MIKFISCVSYRKLEEGWLIARQQRSEMEQVWNFLNEEKHLLCSHWDIEHHLVLPACVLLLCPGPLPHQERWHTCISLLKNLKDYEAKEVSAPRKGLVLQSGVWVQWAAGSGWGGKALFVLLLSFCLLKLCQLNFISSGKISHWKWASRCLWGTLSLRWKQITVPVLNSIVAA